MTVQLNDRQQHVLWATVQHYVATAEPVGSKAIANEYNLSVSPATIRHAFSLLEKAGLLYQPHTSAGRVPSDWGYRVYVDQLLQPAAEQTKRQVETLLSQKLNWSERDFEAVLQGAAQILSTLSGYITLITMPHGQTACLRHLQLVQVGPQRAMLVVVTDSYDTQSTLVDLPVAPEEEIPNAETVDRELEILSNFLNSQLRGQPLNNLPELDWSELDREFQRYGNSLKNLLAELSHRLYNPPVTRMLVGGVSEVLRHPEFSELQQLQALLHLLEDEQDLLWPLIYELPETDSQDKRVNIRIGSENPLEPIRNCTLISSTYRQGNLPVGSVCFLGPTRMRYEDAIAMVESTADYFSSIFS
ncbi:heat-inducible transcriptional repressor HrcA [Geitlerinema sp. PCC 9228]|jgi:heat-inducible transcriptional repressor|uniref:heat-inducible transcriptional repressor HrcA n=1 Tax=Geitlerinema sp. PCC 9228 TaxID=111611 RepID=UPI0008F9ACBC|nr:heat-inducible transcriptional repressor HrcA [Geitlerinema sp. PCC 9228]